jgi:hypothetical protein
MASEPCSTSVQRGTSLRRAFSQEERSFRCRMIGMSLTDTHTTVLW